MSRSLCKCSRVTGFVLFGILMIFATRRMLYPTARGTTSVAVTTRIPVGSTRSHFEASTTIFGAVIHTPGTSIFLKAMSETNPASDASTKRARSTSPRLQAPTVKGQFGVSCANGTAAAAEKHVAINPPNIDSRRLGNQLFNLAAVLMVARLTQRTPIFPTGWLDDAFDIGVDRITASQTERRVCPCYTFHERHSMHFDERLLDLSGVPERGVLLSGYFQSWKYLKYVENELRCRLRFRDSVRKEAEQFLVKHSPTEWKLGTYARIGVHVRRGDFLNPRLRQHGYTTPTMTYFRSAIDYFRKRHSRMHLVVTSDDLAWTKENFAELRTSDVTVTFSEGNTGPVDLAILTSCHSLVLSTGTFGWWAAWLANVTTLYFKDWPQPGSVLESHLKRDDFFPPQWMAT